jgi:hypothetical protein
MEISVMLNHWFSKMPVVFLVAVLLLSISPGVTSVPLYAQEATQPKRALKYTCPMHAEVVSHKPGKCPKCGMSLVESRMETENKGYQWNLHSNKYRMDLVTNPDTITSNEQVELTFSIQRAGGSKNLILKTQHEKKLHLIVVDQKLNYFAHIHPTLNTNGSLSVEACFPPGAFVLFADVFPDGADHNQVFRFQLATDDAPPASSAALDSARLTSAADDYTVALSPTPSILKANQSVELRLTIMQNGKPVRDLKPYLGALGVCPSNHRTTLKWGFIV